MDRSHFVYIYLFVALSLSTHSSYIYIACNSAAPNNGAASLRLPPESSLITYSSFQLASSLVRSAVLHSSDWTPFHSSPIRRASGEQLAPVALGGDLRLDHLGA